MNKKNHVDRLIATVLFGLLVGGESFSAAEAATRYVDKANPQCSDSGPGTAQTPFCTISKGAAVAVAGDRVEVASGTYPERVSPTNSGTSAAPVIFTVANGAAVTVTGQDYGFHISSRSWIEVHGFTISDTVLYGIRVQNSTNITLSDNHVTRAGEPVSGSTRQGIYLNNVTDSLLLRNTVDYNSDAGIYLVNGTTRVRVERNVTHHNAREYVRAAAGIDVRSPGNTIQGNISYDNEDTGIQFYVGSSDNLAVNNVCYRGGDHGIDVSSAPRHTLVGNTVYLTATSGINVEGSAVPSTNATLANNISMDNDVNVRPTATKATIRVDSNSVPGTVIDYDLVFKSQGNYPLIRWGAANYSSLSTFVAATGMETHGIEADPQWVAPGSGDFHLTGFSPAIDSANSGVTGATDSDIESQPRVDDPATPNTGTGPRTYDDRGAYEFQFQPPDNPVPSITGLSPNSATAGGPAFTLTVNGDNFVTGSVVRWNGSDRTTTYVGATQLTAQIPASDIAAAGSASVTVFNPAPGGGISSAQTFTINPADNPVPSITGLSPNSATAGGPAFTLTVNGDNFVTGSVVRWNGSDRTTTYVGATQLTAQIPASDIAAAGSASVTVFNPAPGGGISSAQTFTINPSEATLTFTSTADATIKPGSPTTNFGSSKLEIDNSPVEEFLLKFTVSGVGSRSVTGAKLRLYNINNSDKGGDFYRVADNSWAEGSVTWNNAPVADAAVLASLGAVAANIWVEVNLSTALITGDGTYSLRVKSTSADGADYRSKETAGFAPQLVVTVQ